MQIASRALGTVLALAGLVFLALSVFVVVGGFDRKYVLIEPGPDRTVWIAGAFSAALGVALVLTGRYLLRLKTAELDEAQGRPARGVGLHLIGHRHGLKIGAQVGFVISLLRLTAASFGMD
jgi:hypothetical protein